MDLLHNMDLLQNPTRISVDYRVLLTANIESLAEGSIDTGRPSSLLRDLTTETPWLAFRHAPVCDKSAHLGCLLAERLTRCLLAACRNLSAEMVFTSDTWDQVIV